MKSNPLIHGYSRAAHSKNVATLRREGYGPKQANAIAYRIQRQELRRHGKSTRSIAPRRRRRAMENPSPAVNTAIKWLGGAALVGGALGVVGAIGAPKATNTAAKAMSGAGGAVSVVAVGGLIYGLIEPKDRDAAFATAGLGLGLSIVLGIIGGINQQD